MLHYDTKVSGYRDLKTDVYMRSFEVVCHPVGSDGEDARYYCTAKDWESANRIANRMNAQEALSCRPERPSLATQLHQYNLARSC